jgi:hypothetical protein
MFRRILCLGLCLALGAASVSASQARRAGRPAAAAAAAAPALSGELARLFPADTAVYMEFADLASALEQLGGSEELYKAIDAALVDFRALIPGTTLASERLRAVLASKVGMAVILPSTGAILSPRTFDNLSVAAVIRLPSSETASFLRDALDVASKSVVTGAPRAKAPIVRTVAGVKLTVYPDPKPGETLAYGFAGDTMVAGTLSGVTALLQTASAPSARRLADSPSFAAASSRLAGPRHGFVYVNGAPIVRLFESSFDASYRPARGKGPARPSAAAAAFKAFLGMKSLKAFAAAAQIDGPTLRVQASAEIDRTREGLVTVLTDPPAISVQAANFLPSDTEYLTVYSLDAPRIYDLVMKSLTPAVTKEMKLPPMSENVAKAEELIGMRLRDDLLTAFGNEVAFGVKLTSLVGTRTAPNVAPLPQAPPADLGPGDMRVEEDPAVPEDTVVVGSTMPEVVFLAEVRSPETVKRAIQQLAVLMGAPADAIRATDRNGVEVWVAKDVAWAFLDGFMLIGSTPAVERSVDAHETRSTLATSPAYVAWGAIPANTIAASYVSPGVFSTLAKEASKEINLGFQMDLGNSFPNGILTTGQKDATGVYVRYEIPVREAWKALLDSVLKGLMKKKTAAVQTEAVGTLRWVGSAEATFFAEKGRFATLDELRAATMLPSDFSAAANYRLDLTVTNDGKGFAASMTPVEYGNPARDSYFMDESYVVRYVDRQGAPATAADPAIGER